MFSISRRWRTVVQTAVVAALCVVGSFAVGMNTSDNVRTIASLEAGMPLGDGDADGNGVVDIHDVIELLEVVRGYRETVPQHLIADPNGDGEITVDDALQLLNELALP